MITIKNENIICISSIDWDFIWQGHQEVMSTLAANGNRVLFIENTGVRSPTLEDLPRLKKRLHNWFHSVKGIRKEKENLFIYSPIILPFPYSRIARRINKYLIMSALKRWIKSAGFSNPIIWTFLPTGLVLDILDSIDGKMVIYYCIDNFAASSSQARKIRETEKRLFARSDLVFVTSTSLYEQAAQYNSNVYLFPYGVNIELYGKAYKNKAAPPEDIAPVRRPIVGYVGGIHKWLDFDLIRFMAKSNPDKSFVFVGPLQRSITGLDGMKNIHFLGQKRYDELPSYISQFDVCIIPYLLTEYTRNVYPTKMNEYLALGKAVISTPIREVESFNERNDNIVYTGRTKEDFSAALNQVLSQETSDVVYKKRIAIAAEEGSWETKIDKMCGLIKKKMVEKEIEMSLGWKDNLLKLYRGSKRRLMPLVVGVAAAYLAIFYTPLVWLAADPLKLSSSLEKADVIVVFAGGVGESGKAGQGYEERVQYAVELYKKGYAKKIIFSSGYVFVFQEPLLMKAVAISLGVPESDIILESSARNTYENVAFTRKILARKGWGKILLVSSPYHMKRAALVFKKVGTGIEVLYAPLPKSEFYAHATTGILTKKAEVRQIRGIFHEYLSIVYYWWKGYI